MIETKGNGRNRDEIRKLRHISLLTLWDLFLFLLAGLDKISF